MKFKVGDRITHKEYSGDPKWSGVLTDVRTMSDSLPYRVVWDCEDFGWYSKETIESKYRHDAVLTPYDASTYLQQVQAKGPVVLEYNNVVFSDIDDTLHHVNLSDFPDAEKVTFTNDEGLEVTLLPHKKNINQLKWLAKQGMSNFVWSKAGYKWAQTVIRELKLEPYVKAIMSKGDLYLDDKEAELWMGRRLWRPLDSSEKGETA